MLLPFSQDPTQCRSADCFFGPCSEPPVEGQGAGLVVAVDELDEAALASEAEALDEIAVRMRTRVFAVESGKDSVSGVTTHRHCGGTALSMMSVTRRRPSASTSSPLSFANRGTVKPVHQMTRSAS